MSTTLMAIALAVTGNPPLINYARHTVNVEKILADTDANRKRLISEVGELFYSA